MTETPAPAFTVTVSGGSRARARSGAGAHMTLHRGDCPVVKRAAQVRPGYLHGWISADGRAIERGVGHLDTPAQVSPDVAAEIGEEVWDDTEKAVTAYARYWVERSVTHPWAYRVCGRCKPEEAL